MARKIRNNTIKEQLPSHLRRSVVFSVFHRKIEHTGPGYLHKMIRDLMKAWCTFVILPPSAKNRLPAYDNACAIHTVRMRVATVN